MQAFPQGIYALFKRSWSFVLGSIFIVNFMSHLPRVFFGLPQGASLDTLTELSTTSFMFAHVCLPAGTTLATATKADVFPCSLAKHRGTKDDEAESSADREGL